MSPASKLVQGVLLLLLHVHVGVWLPPPLVWLQLEVCEAAPLGCGSAMTASRPRISHTWWHWISATGMPHRIITWIIRPGANMFGVEAAARGEDASQEEGRQRQTLAALSRAVAS